MIREPLSFAMGTRGKVGCLRVLALIPGPITQRELARRARFQHRTVQLALEDLVACGVVARVEGGRDFLVSLNHEHRLAPTLRELFRQEAEHFLELRQDLVRALGGLKKNVILSLSLFGSVARGEDSLQSDLDTLCITADERARAWGLERIEATREGMSKRFGARIRPIVYTLSEARNLWRTHRAPLVEAVRDGIVLVGPPLRDLLNGKD